MRCDIQTEINPWHWYCSQPDAGETSAGPKPTSKAHEKTVTCNESRAPPYFYELRTRFARMPSLRPESSRGHGKREPSHGERMTERGYVRAPRRCTPRTPKALLSATSGPYSDALDSAPRTSPRFHFPSSKRPACIQAEHSEEKGHPCLS